MDEDQVASMSDDELLQLALGGDEQPEGADEGSGGDEPAEEQDDDAQNTVRFSDVFEAETTGQDNQKGKPATKPEKPAVEVPPKAAPAKPAQPAKAEGQPQGADGNPAPVVKPNTPPETTPPRIYKTQKEVDRAMGAVKKAERAKVQQELAPDLEIARTIRMAFPNGKPEEILAAVRGIRNEKLGFTEEQAAAIDMLQGQVNDVRGRIDSTVQEPAAEDDAADEGDQGGQVMTPQQLGQHLSQWANTAGKRFANVDPDFNIVEFFRKPERTPLLNELAAGRISMDDVYAQYRLPELVAGGQKAQAQARQRERNREVPDTLRSGAPAGAGMGAPDFEHMSDADFEKADAVIKGQADRGRKVVFR